MEKKDNSINIEELKSYIKKNNSGVSLSDILNHYPNIAKRTTQRRVKTLVDMGIIYPQGKGPARRYFFEQEIDLDNQHQSNDEFPNYIPISADSRDIIAYLERPQPARIPVGYQVDFLKNYIPNETLYLSKSLCEQLNKMGNTHQSKLPVGTYGREILDRLLIDLSWASSQLEGNTYSYLDTRKLIQDGKKAKGKSLIETQMILNHKSAIELLVDNIEKLKFDNFSVLNIHSALSENLLPNPSDEGRVRKHIVQITKSVFRPLSIPSQIIETLAILLEKADQIIDPFEQAFFIMVHIPYLQPFADLNKRTSRLMANLPLIRNNLCPLTFLDVPEVAYSKAILGIYELTRIELLRDLFVWSYERSTQEYLAIKQELIEPDPIRLEYGSDIKKIVYQVITNYETDVLTLIKQTISEKIDDVKNYSAIESMIIDELRRLHEGVLARYGLRLSEYMKWKKYQQEKVVGN